MIISNSRQFVFIHIHKAGGSSMELALDPYLGWNDIVLGSTPIGRAINIAYQRRFGLEKHSSVSDVEQVCGVDIIETYFVFALVRHPLDRICSLYNFAGGVVQRAAAQLRIAPEALTNHIESDQHVLKQIPGLTWPATVAFLQTASFSEFLRNGNAAHDIGCRTQVSRLRRSKSEPIFAEFYRLECIPDWLPAMRGNIGIDFEFPHENKREFTFVTPDEVCADDRKFVEDFYAEDFAAFGY